MNGIQEAALQPESGAQSEDWTTIIRPQRRWFDLRLGDVWAYRDLIAIFVRRDFAATYKQTILGPFWYLLRPLFSTVVFTVIFGNIAKLSTDGLPPFLFYMSGTVIWSYFAACLTITADTFVANAGLFGKVYFSRLAVPMSLLITNLISLSMQLTTFVAFLVCFSLSGADVRPGPVIVLTPLLILMMAGHGLGWGLLSSSLTTRYRNLQQVVGFGTQLLMYATPVIYPVSAVPPQYR